MANESLLGITRKGSSFDKRYTPEYRETLRNEYRLTFNDLEFNLKPPSAGASCLDFGCAIGSALDVLADNGWETYGCDISEQLTALADRQQHRIFTGELDQLPGDWGPFDLVVTIEVLEHLQHPRETLHRLISLLKPGGTLITETPQVGLLAELYGEDWRVLAGLDHIHLLTRETQIGVIEDFGCRVEATSSFGSGCTMGLVPPHIKRAFDTLVKRQNIGDFLAIRATKIEV
ncbi:hypothetical protein BOW51_07130 [Solemya velesiana gill symbiont]|uniref:Methyltransferase type 11 domain-containing protein n=2 Tax=Solemya velesiana gill symbiont TaxID=1918948 RepID=A0A1T2KUA4_9GAMM|nr:hypothetical protein BOW51_07130 [Solemya velesiana gill symbiont]